MVIQFQTSLSHTETKLSNRKKEKKKKKFVNGITTSCDSISFIVTKKVPQSSMPHNKLKKKKKKP